VSSLSIALNRSLVSSSSFDQRKACHHPPIRAHSSQSANHLSHTAKRPFTDNPNVMSQLSSDTKDFANLSASTPLVASRSSSRVRGQTISTPGIRPNNPDVTIDNGTRPTRRNLTFSPSASARPTSSGVNAPNPYQRPSRANTVVHYSRHLGDQIREHSSASSEYSQSSTATLYDHERPGAEPGIDTNADIPEPKFNSLVTVSQTSLVDFSPTKLERHEFTGSDDLLAFLENPRADWAKCRWINVNGLDWKIIKAIGNRYKLHRLAIEDLISPGGRAKVDWYSGNVYSKPAELFTAALTS
jgi:hypothetical protein